jgi:hypothetical protein
MYDLNRLLDEYGQPPPPLDCHPAYADMPWIREWVEGKSFKTQALRIPVIQRPRLEMIETDPFHPEILKQRMMERHKIWGIAPYVGDPFVYVWFCGVDDLGRHVCGDSEIHYLPLGYQFF